MGGSDLGLYAAAAALGVRVEVVDAIDSDPVAVRCYNANLPHPVARVADVKRLTRADLPPHDLVIGGPPCQDHSLAGKRACRCDKGEPAVDRCCLADFLRLATGSPWLMENVRSRLINAPWSEQLCAADFGDVTSRKRWFYSDHLLHVWPTPGPRRIRDIRDHAEDERILAKRGLTCKAGNHTHYDSLDSLDSLTAHAWHGHDVRSGKLMGPGIWTGDELQAVTSEDAFMPTLTATDFHGTKNNGSGRPTKGSKIALPRVRKDQTHPPKDDHEMLNSLSGGVTGVSGNIRMTLKLGLRGNSASASAFEDENHLGSILSNSWHGNEASRLEGCRNPSLLEMARAHSIPDSFDWAGATKAQRGKMIANSWPVGLATAVCRSMLVALGANEAAAGNPHVVRDDGGNETW